jgi:hypothetical protein
MIRNYGVVRCARPNDHASEHENIFIAKIRDSESANGAVNYVARLTQRLIAQEMRHA